MTTLSFRLSHLFAASFAGLGFSLPFFPVWLKHTGLGDAAIGVILAGPMLMRIVTTTTVAGLADRHIEPARLLAVLNGVVAIGYLLLWPQTAFWPILLTVLVISVGQSGIVPVADTLANTFVSHGAGRGSIDYGRVRVWGSISFLVVNLAGGFIIHTAGIGVVPLVMSLCAVWAVCAALLAPQLPTERPAGRDGQEHAAQPSLPLARQKQAFALLLAGSALVQASHGALYAFGTLHWQAQGVADVAIGALWAIGVAAEILLFMVAGRIARPGLAGLAWVMAGGAFAALRFGAMALMPGGMSTIALQVLHGLSFGLTHMGTIAAIGVLAPTGRRGRAQGQVTAIHAIAMAGATMLSGLLYARVAGWTFLAMVPLALAGLVCAHLARGIAAADPVRRDV